MVEVDDPKTCLMFHMMTTLEPIDPVLESPLSDPMARQTAAACSLLTEIAATKVASEGMLLANLEKDGKMCLYLLKILVILKSYAYIISNDYQATTCVSIIPIYRQRNSFEKYIIFFRKTFSKFKYKNIR